MVLLHTWFKRKVKPINRLSRALMSNRMIILDIGWKSSQICKLEQSKIITYKVNLLKKRLLTWNKTWICSRSLMCFIVSSTSSIIIKISGPTQGASLQILLRPPTATSSWSRTSTCRLQAELPHLKYIRPLIAVSFSIWGRTRPRQKRCFISLATAVVKASWTSFRHSHQIITLGCKRSRSRVRSKCTLKAPQTEWVTLEIVWLKPLTVTAITHQVQIFSCLTTILRVFKRSNKAINRNW